MTNSEDFKNIINPTLLYMLKQLINVGRNPHILHLKVRNSEEMHENKEWFIRKHLPLLSFQRTAVSWFSGLNVTLYDYMYIYERMCIHT